MRGYFKEDQGRGDFSTSFGDMIFGLLFFFFILTLAMVFNRSDVGSFHQEIDQLRRQVQQKDQQLKEWQARYDALKRTTDEMQRTLAQLKKAQEADRKKLQESVEAHKLLQKQYQSILASLNTVTAQYNQLLTQYTQLQAKYSQSPKDQAKALQDQLSKAQQENEGLKIKLTAFQNILGKLKQILQQKGLTDILAEVEKMEKGDKKAAQGDDTPPSVYKVFAKLYPDGYLDVRVVRGETEMSAAFNVSDRELFSLAGDVKQSYGDEAQSFSEEERVKTQPKIFLMASPEIQYGMLQDFLAKANKVLPVSIVPWKND